MVRTGGLQSSAFAVPITVEGTIITAGAKILTNDLVITKDLINGDSGMFRLWIGFTTLADADFQITLTKLGGADFTTSPLKLNADNTFILLSDGYYWFNVNVEPGDLINFTASVNITSVNEVRFQNVPIAT